MTSRWPPLTMKSQEIETPKKRLTAVSSPPLIGLKNEAKLRPICRPITSPANSIAAKTIRTEKPSETPTSTCWSTAVTPAAVLLTDKKGNIWALDRSTGNSLWKQNLLENRQLTTPVVMGDYGVVGDFEGYLHWFRLDTGDIVGRQKVEGAAIRGTPQLSPEGTLYALTNEGELAAYRLGN